MTKIIVVSTENMQEIGVAFAGGLSPEEAQVMCTAAVRYFQEMAIEAEVERRLLALEVEQRLKEVKE